MRLWWRSLVLFDVPVFKFVTAQVGSLGLLGFLLYLVGLHFWVFAVLAFHSHRMSVSGDHLNVAVPPAAGLTHSVIPALPPPP